VGLTGPYGLVGSPENRTLSEKGRPMESKNEVHLAGELVADPRLATTASGKQFASLLIRTSRKQYSETNRATAWGALSAKASTLRKGDFVKVFGFLQSSAWTDKETRQRRYSTSVVVWSLDTGDEPPAESGGAR
jgi:single-stranded DNA-binding protein